MKKIAVIGAGCSGLAAIKSCLDEDLLPVCYEREDDIGGLWNWTETPKTGKGSVYKTCVINTSKEMMAFSDFPPPAHFPVFMPHNYVLQYFKLYEEKFGLKKYIKFKITVIAVKHAEDYDQSGRWNVTYQAEDSATERTETFDGVLICTGHHAYPYTPDFPGVGTFKGISMHSHSYRDNTQFKNKRVLVVGIGNSAVDIAVDVSQTASQVFLSTRRGAWIVSRKGFWGFPNDALANSRFITMLPRTFLQWCLHKISNLNFDHQTFGIEVAHGALETHPTINDELPIRIMIGGIKIRPGISKFSSKGVYFTDETYEEIDAVIFATGFNYKIPFLDQSISSLHNNETCLYKYMFPPSLQHPTLAIIGLVQAIGAVMPISEMQCRWYTRVIKGSCSLPCKKMMLDDILTKKENMKKLYVHSKRHTLQVDWIEYMDEIASEFGARPSFLKLLLSDPYLAIRCFFGPCLPAQFRLQGPGTWVNAKACIENAFYRWKASMNNNIRQNSCS